MDSVMMNNLIGLEEDMVKELHTICPVIEKLEIIDKHCSEATLEIRVDDFGSGSALFECNPFEGQMWLVLEGLKYIDEVNEIKIEKAQRPDKEDDCVTVWW